MLVTVVLELKIIWSIQVEETIYPKNSFTKASLSPASAGRLTIATIIFRRIQKSTNAETERKLEETDTSLENLKEVDTFIE